MKRLEEELNAAEALFGFCGWLTTRDKETVMSAHDNASPIVDLIGKFIDHQGLAAPRDGWDKLLKSMKGISEAPHVEVDDDEYVDFYRELDKKGWMNKVGAVLKADFAKGHGDIAIKNLLDDSFFTLAFVTDFANLSPAEQAKLRTAIPYPKFWAGLPKKEGTRGSLRRKDQEITNEPSRVADLALGVGSTYTEEGKMKKLSHLLDEEEARGGLLEDVVASDYFSASMKEEGDGTDIKITMSGGERLRGGIADNRADTLQALKQMDAIMEKLISNS